MTLEKLDDTSTTKEWGKNDRNNPIGKNACKTKRSYAPPVLDVTDQSFRGLMTCHQVWVHREGMIFIVTSQVGGSPRYMKGR